MPAAALPANELSRLAMLESIGILDTAPEDDYDDIVRIAAAICGTPSATISLVAADRQWFKARLGQDDPQTPRSLSFCAHAILDPERPLVVGDATNDTRFADHPAVLDGNLRFYAGAPVLAGGLPIGTVCVFDREPHTLEAGQIEALQALSRQVARLIELRKAGRLLNLHLREREWYERQWAEHQRSIDTHAGSRPDAAAGALLGLPDRRAFDVALEEEIASLAADEDLQVALVELDALPTLRELHGADEAKQALQWLAGTLRGGTATEGRLARVGSGFGLIMRMPFAQALGQCQVLRELAQSPASGIPVSLSIGLARRERGEGASALVDAAAQALLRAHGAGGDRVETR